MALVAREERIMTAPKHTLPSDDLKERLLPCPFCGRNPHKKLGKMNDDGMQDLIIECPTWHARISCINHGAAISGWNTRAPDARIEALEAQLAEKDRWNRLRAEDIITLGAQVGKLETQLSTCQAENEELRDMLMHPDPDSEPDNVRLHREKCDMFELALTAQAQLAEARKALEPFAQTGWMPSAAEHDGLTVIAYVHADSRRELVLSSEDFFRAAAALPKDPSTGSGS
jgi:hypothetical protein